MARSRLTHKEQADLYDSQRIVAEYRDLADAGDIEARKIVAAARENVSRLKAKRDNKIWL